MAPGLSVSIGQCSAAGRKPANEDFHGAIVPGEPALSLKGVALAVADGISSSRVSAVASSTAVRSVLDDYYCTSDAWSVKTSASRVIAAVNSWLHAETRRSGAYDRDRGYVCTLSLLILKGGAAHIFHVGDSRVSRVAGSVLEQLTDDHRVILSTEQSYLGRALGIAPNVEIDYRTVPLAPGDVFVLTTDGVHDHLGADAIVAEIQGDLDEAAQRIVERAHRAGSPDNLTVQLVRIDTLPAAGWQDLLEQGGERPPAPLLGPGAVLDGYRVLRSLHDSSRTHLYLAADGETGGKVVLKVPSIDRRDDRDYLRRLLMEEWVARRLDSPHVLKAPPHAGQRTHLYAVLDFVEGETLAQWMRDHPDPALEAVRGIIEQVARGLEAFHRKEMVHGDLRPENVMLDAGGAAKIIDFGSAEVAGLAELDGARDDPRPLGTAQYAAPERLLSEAGTARSDIFSLGVIAYQMLTGRLPYGADAAKLQSRKQLRGLRYQAAATSRPSLPPWVDGALRKAVHPSAAQRYAAASEFAHDLRHPNPDFFSRAIPLAERDPVMFWKAVSLVLALATLVLLVERFAPG